MKWVEALKKFNDGKGAWCIPRKGSREHKEVLSIMQGATLYTNTRSEKARREKGLKQIQRHLDQDDPR